MTLHDDSIMDCKTNSSKISKHWLQTNECRETDVGCNGLWQKRQCLIENVRLILIGDQPEGSLAAIWCLQIVAGQHLVLDRILPLHHVGNQCVELAHQFGRFLHGDRVTLQIQLPSNGGGSSAVGVPIEDGLHRNALFLLPVAYSEDVVAEFVEQISFGVGKDASKIFVSCKSRNNSALCLLVIKSDETIVFTEDNKLISDAFVSDNVL